VVKLQIAKINLKYQRGNQNPYIERQTIQWTKYKKDKQNLSTNISQKTKD